MLSEKGVRHPNPCPLLPLPLQLQLLLLLLHYYTTNNYYYNCYYHYYHHHYYCLSFKQETQSIRVCGKHVKSQLERLAGADARLDCDGIATSQNYVTNSDLHAIDHSLSRHMH